MENNKLLIQIEQLPANWASALLNNEYSGLNEADSQEVINWRLENPQLSNCKDCSEIAVFSQFDGLRCDCLDFVFYVESKE